MAGRCGQITSFGGELTTQVFYLFWPLAAGARQTMQDDRNKVAALNNAEWCAAVWRSHGLPVEQAHGMWFCPYPTPQYYPNVVTVDAGAEPTKQAGLIAE